MRGMVDRAKFVFIARRGGSQSLYYKRPVPKELHADGRPMQIWRSVASAMLDLIRGRVQVQLARRRGLGFRPHLGALSLFALRAANGRSRVICVSAERELRGSLLTDHCRRFRQRATAHAGRMSCVDQPRRLAPASISKRSIDS